MYMFKRVVNNCIDVLAEGRFIVKHFTNILVRFHVIENYDGS